MIESVLKYEILCILPADDLSYNICVFPSSCCIIPGSDTRKVKTAVELLAWRQRVWIRGFRPMFKKCEQIPCGAKNSARTHRKWDWFPQSSNSQDKQIMHQFARKQPSGIWPYSFLALFSNSRVPRIIISDLAIYHAALGTASVLFEVTSRCQFPTKTCECQ